MSTTAMWLLLAVVVVAIVFGSVLYKRTFTTKELALTGVMAALSLVAYLFFRLPFYGGSSFHLGNTFTALTALLLDGAQLIGELGRAFQQTGVQIEHVAGVSLTSRGTADQQRQCTVGHGVLGQVVVDNEDVLALMHEIFAHGTAGVGCDILQGRKLGCRCGHHDGVAHGTGFGQALHHW